MNISQAIESLNKIYTPGVLAFYQNFPNDPWQKAHDDLNAVVQLQNLTLTSLACENFLKTCVELVQQFKNNQIPTKGISPQDAFNIGTEDRLKKWKSIKFKQCYLCENKNNLALISNPNDRTSALFICKNCR